MLRAPQPQRAGYTALDARYAWHFGRGRSTTAAINRAQEYVVSRPRPRLYGCVGNRRWNYLGR